METPEATNNEAQVNKHGVFKADLMRSFKTLKESRAESVAEDAQIVYKRQIEDLCHQIRNYDRDRDNLINDLSPTSAFAGNVVPSDFKASDFMQKDLEIGLNKRDAIIRLEIMIERYEYLFGEITDKAAILKVLPNHKFKI